jgi:Cu(I)/Ag(I) efflux system periplasmic protein CusF
MIAKLSSSKELNMITTKITAVAFVLSLALSSVSAFAQAAMANGEVKKIDEAAGKITLKHGPIKSLDMEDEMTMVFRVQDPAMLKQVKVGDKVKFDAERAPAGITITKIQKGK